MENFKPCHIFYSKLYYFLIDLRRIYLYSTNHSHKKKKKTINLIYQ